VLLPAKVFRGRKSINWAKSVLPMAIGDSREDPGSMLRLQIEDTGFTLKPAQLLAFRAVVRQLTGQQ
jgi:hypothetical protein